MLVKGQFNKLNPCLIFKLSNWIVNVKMRMTLACQCTSVLWMQVHWNEATNIKILFGVRKAFAIELKTKHFCVFSFEHKWKCFNNWDDMVMWNFSDSRCLYKRWGEPTRPTWTWRPLHKESANLTGNVLLAYHFV